MHPTTVSPQPLDLSPLSESERLAFFGALFAVAAADDRIDERESEQILASLDLRGLSEEGRQRAFALSISPPSLQSCLDALRGASPEIRRGLMINLVDVALADDEIEPGEPMSLEQARIGLGITPEEVEAMHAYVFRARDAARGRPLPRPMACPPDLR